MYIFQMTGYFDLDLPLKGDWNCFLIYLQKDKSYPCMYDDQNQSGRDRLYLERIGPSVIKTKFDMSRLI